MPVPTWDRWHRPAPTPVRVSPASPVEAILADLARRARQQAVVIDLTTRRPTGR